MIKGNKVQYIMPFNKMTSWQIFHMPMQHIACFSIHSVHIESEVPPLVHAHALCNQTQRKTVYSVSRKPGH